MPDDTDNDLKENRFSYLLQPIRDLAANWDINIAGELEEYLDELENLTFTIEGCGPALNFAEAALLIQGTTCVFSKKVEYLHTLVYQALETIFNKKQKERQAAANKDKAARSAAILAGAELDDIDFFFSLDQHLDLAAAADIDLGDDDETSPPELLRPPTALLALEDAAAGQGNAQAGQLYSSSCRLTQCTVHVSGALLLESRDGELYDALLRPTAATRSRRTARMGAGTASGVIPTMRTSLEGSSLQGWQQHGSSEAAMAATGGAVKAVDDDDDPGHEGYADDDCQYLDNAEAMDMQLEIAQQQSGMDAAPAVGVHQHRAMIGIDHIGSAAEGANAAMSEWLADAGSTGGNADAIGEAAAEDVCAAAAAANGSTATDGADHGTSNRRVQRQQGKGQHGLAAEQDYYDPYMPLDPADPGSLPIKPLQVRKPKRCTRLPEHNQQSTAVARLNASYHPNLHWPELGYILDKLHQAAAAARIASRGQQDRKKQQREQAASLLAVGPQVAAVMDWQDAAAAEEREQEMLMMDAKGGDDVGAGDYGYEDDYDATGVPGPNLMSTLDEAAVEGSWSKLGSMPAWMTGVPHTPGNPDDLSYEELCRSHMESLIAAAAAQQVQSELAVRVSGWRARIDPILAAEEDRSAFDMHKYGTKLLDRLMEFKQVEVQQQQQEQDIVADFQQVAAAEDSFEVCRLFAAMLQLVNNRNINLIKEIEPVDADGASSVSPGSSGCHALQLQLLTVARVHEAMAEGLAAGNNDDAEENCPVKAKAASKSRKARRGQSAAVVATAAANGATKQQGRVDRKSAATNLSSKKVNRSNDEISSAGSGDDTDSVVSDGVNASPQGVAKNSRNGNGARQKAAGKAAEAAAGGTGDSDRDFDANAEDQGVRADTVFAGKVQASKPPAKRARRVGAAVS